jgi:4-hydroxyphenylpyruvate dioxygenase
MANLEGVLFVEIYVGMAKMVAWWHEYALGFQLVGKRVSQGRHGKQITYWLRQGEANLLVTSAMEPAAHDVVSFVDRHGNSIRAFAVETDRIEDKFHELRDKGAIFLAEGVEWIRHNDQQAGIIRCKLFDDNELLFVERINCGDDILPGFERADIENDDLATNIIGIDHLASVVRINESEYWIAYLERLLDLQHVQCIGDEFFANLITGMKMHVLSSKTSKLNKVIVEPLPKKSRSSQVDVFLENHYGTGIQHLAFAVNDLVETVAALKGKKVAFTKIPDAYYVQLRADFPDLPIDILQKANILCEQEGDKLLLQVFTEPIGDRPTLFYEFIQRVNHYDGFGANNVKQLFKSLELQIAPHE